MRRKKRKIDHRHIVCILITLGFLACFLLFPSALGRIVEGVCDVFNSTAFAFCRIFRIESDITPTVNELPKISPTYSVLIPVDWDGFKEAWSRYWSVWASGETFVAYMRLLLQVMIYAVVAIAVIAFLFLLFKRWLKRYLRKQCTKVEDSKALKLHKWITKNVYLRVKWWLTEFFVFVRERRVYWITWLCIWAFYFNLFTIAIEAVAYVLYLLFTGDFLFLYRQVYKLLLDLKAPLSFIPVWGWAILALVLFDRWRKKIAYDRQWHMEAMNCGFWKARPIVTMICATMGKGKTTMMTDGALSDVVMQRTTAFEKILENDLKFPYFPWINFEWSIQRAMDKHLIYNLATARLFVKRRCEYFKKHPLVRNCFGYDFEYYGYTYDDKLKVVTVWEVLETYAQLYFMYIIHSATLLSNYSVRLDDMKADLGNFPRWNSDFFRRDSRLLESYSRHAKILDFNALRLGLKLGTDRTFADVFEFGTVLITEVGKERGNNLENREKKKSDLEANQRNDGFNMGLKMRRHSATVDGHPFVRIITDEQRPESWGADARDLCEIVHIREKSECRLSLPFFHLTELLYSWVFNKFASIYYEYRFNRSDNTLPMWLLKSFTAKIEHYYKNIYNRFGYCVLSGDVERGTQDGTVQTFNYFIQFKKIYANRFSTDCFSDYFTVRALRSPVGLDDMPEYETEKATFEELRRQNSYFVNDLLAGMDSDD